MAESLFNPFVTGAKMPSEEIISKMKGHYEHVVPYPSTCPIASPSNHTAFLHNWALYTSDKIDPECHNSLKNPLLKPYFTASCRIFNLENNALRSQSGIFVSPTLILSTIHFGNWKGEMPIAQELDPYLTNLSNLKVSNSINGRYSSFSGRPCRLVWYNLPSELCLFELLDLSHGESFIPLSSFRSVDINTNMKGKRAFTCGYNETNPNNEVSTWAQGYSATLSPTTVCNTNQTWKNFSFNDCFHPDDKSATTGQILPPTVQLVPLIDNKQIAQKYVWVQLPTWRGHSGAAVILEEDMKIFGLVGAHINAEPTRVIPFTENTLSLLSDFVTTR